MGSILKRSWNRKAFTLMEMLMALFIVSLIMISLQMLVQQFNQYEQMVKNNRSTEWHQLLKAIQTELDNGNFLKCDNHHLFYETPENQFEIFLRNHIIQIRPGYHPLMYEVQDWSIVEENNILSIQLLTDQNEYFEGSLVIWSEN